MIAVLASVMLELESIIAVKVSIKIFVSYVLNLRISTEISEFLVGVKLFVGMN